MSEKTADFFGGAEREQLLYAQLKLMGVQKVVADFNGGGDSGQIEEVALCGAEDVRLPEEVHKTEVMGCKMSQTHVDGSWVVTFEDKMMPIVDVLEAACYAALEKCGLDWYNNDGGQGELTIDLTRNPPTVKLQVGINYTTTDEHTFDFDTEE